MGLSLAPAAGVLADKAGNSDKSAALAPDLPWADARTLADVLERVKHDYVNPVDDHQLLQAAIRGMVSSLDPYSAYLDSEEYDEIKISSSGEYSGVGIEVSMEDDEVVVVVSLGRLAGGRGGNPLRRRHRHDRRRSREYHQPWRTPSGACAARKAPRSR